MNTGQCNVQLAGQCSLERQTFVINVDNIEQMKVQDVECLLNTGYRFVARIWVDDFIRRYEFFKEGEDYVVNIWCIVGAVIKTIRRDSLVALLCALCFETAEVLPDTDQVPVVKVERRD